MLDRERVRALLAHPRFERAIMAVIVLNAITIGCETSSFVMGWIGEPLHVVDRVVVGVFVLELTARLYAHRGAFFKDPWNWFDAAIVGIALVPASGPASVLRTLRIMRALRLVTVVPSMRRVTSALMAAIPGMASILGLLIIIMYVAAVMATQWFGRTAPEFAEIPTSLFTLFQVMTGEGWPEIADQIMGAHPWAWVFFVAYIVVSSFVVLNLFIAVVVNAMDDESTSAEEQRTDDRLRTIMEELARLHTKLDALSTQARNRGQGDGPEAESSPSLSNAG
ncbi:ion transporter [Nonomuraea diastatica]|uniref:Ion transporter n=1 Tax=Nonomuraea diastatica TaxID=1848329 RepID=A0A4R4X4X9_9ACTN|nr:ion transporter [Nonomuraea diastatica]TDD25289.1 ion transporter [Nonomuraea diastatica]